MPNGLKKKIDEAFGPPQEGIKTLKEFTSGETGKQFDHILAKLEKLSQDTSALPQVIELFKLITECGRAGYLEDLDNILTHIPKGQSGQVLVSELRKTVDKLSPRLDKLSELAKTLMGEE